MVSLLEYENNFFSYLNYEQVQAVLPQDVLQ